MAFPDTPRLAPIEFVVSPASYRCKICSASTRNRRAFTLKPRPTPGTFVRGGFRGRPNLHPNGISSLTSILFVSVSFVIHLVPNAGFPFPELMADMYAECLRLSQPYIFRLRCLPCPAVIFATAAIKLGWLENILTSKMCATKCSSAVSFTIFSSESSPPMHLGITWCRSQYPSS
jgi:hypothetical protein